MIADPSLVPIRLSCLCACTFSNMRTKLIQINIVIMGFESFSALMLRAGKISNCYGDFSSFYTIGSAEVFGSSVASLGDLNGDGVVDMAVGARGDNDGKSGAGAVYVAFLETNGNVKGAQKISNWYGGFSSFYTLGSADLFGASVASLGDLNGDGVMDMAVAANHDDDGYKNAGAVYVAFLETNGYVKGAQDFQLVRRLLVILHCWQRGPLQQFSGLARRS